MGQKETNLVNNAHSEDPAEFQDSFRDAMIDRIGGVLDQKTKEISQHILTPDSFTAEGPEIGDHVVDTLDIDEIGNDDDNQSGDDT